MRLFIAVILENETKDRLEKLQDEIRSQALKGNFTRPENFHMTLAFLGETPEEKLVILDRIINEIQTPPFEIFFNHTGCFTHSHKELWWIGADTSDPKLPLLREMHERLTNRLEEEGFPIDKRPFRAHISLGREIKHSAPIDLSRTEIKVKIDHIGLLKSERIKGVLTYTELIRRKTNGKKT